jgi:hypothetical protein
MASRSSTQSPHTAMSSPSKRSRNTLSRQERAGASEPAGRAKGPSEKKHKNMAEVQTTGRQSAQGDRPGAGKGRSRGG